MPLPKRRFVIEDELTTDAPADAVMGKILDPKTWPVWQSEIRAVSGPERIAEGDEINGDAGLVGFEVEGVSHAREVSGNRFVEDVVVGVRMEVFYDVSNKGGRTVVTRRLEANLPGGVIGTALSVLLRFKLRKMQRDVLRDLAAYASEGSG